MRRTTNYLIVTTIFLDNFVLLRGPFDFYLYYLLFLIFLIQYGYTEQKFGFNRRFFFFLILLVIIGLIKTATISYPFLPVVKQFSAIFFSSLTYYLFIRYNHYEIKEIFRVYMNVAVIICLLGLMQEFLFIMGLGSVNPIYGYRLCSIMGEPAHLAIALSPALFVSLNRWLDADSPFISKPRSLLVILAYLLTFSGVALLGLLVAAILLIKKNLVLTKKQLLGIPVVIAVVFLVSVFAYQLPDIKMRVDDTWKVLSSKPGQLDVQSINLSTYTLFCNYLVAREAFTSNPIFGTGIGTHANSYDLYIPYFFPKSKFKDFSFVDLALNRQDANSLLLRLISETGILGILAFLGFLVMNMLSFVKNKKNNYSLWLINNSLLVFFILRLIRFGNYSALGFFFMFFLYYFSYKQSKLLKHIDSMNSTAFDTQTAIA